MLLNKIRSNESLLRIFKGISATFVNQIINFVYQFVCIIIFIRFWGQAYYGEWLILFSFSQYLSMGDVGISSTISNKMASIVGLRDFNGANRLFINGWFVLSLSSLTLLFILSIFIFLFQTHNFVLIDSEKLLFSTFFILLYVFVFLQTTLFNSIYIANYKFSRQKNFDSIAKVVEFLAILSVLKLGGNAPLISLGMLAVRLLFFIYIYFDLTNLFGWFRFDVKLVNKSTILSIYKPALANMFLNIGYLMYYNGPIIIIGHFLGSVMVSKFYAVSTILRATKQIPLLFNLPLYPEYARLIGLNNLIEAKRMHKTAIITTFLLAMGISIAVYLFSDKLMTLLLKEKLSEVVHPFFEISLIALIIQCVWHASSAVLVSANSHVQLAVYFFSSSLLGYLVILIFINSHGLTAISLGLLLIDFLMFLMTFRLVFN